MKIMRITALAVVVTQLVVTSGCVNPNGTVNNTGTGALNKAAKISALTLTFVNTWMYSAGATNTNQVAVTANPVTTNPEIYDAYLEFLTLPGSLRVSPDDPPDPEPPKGPNS